ncbi:MAG TPA: nucleoside 2-deoxyribosyltransferase [Phycisphaerae bacterium]|nr:nucleoside 2-deoxyribosyltransferase [Phycisphaerae bacterium]
MKIYLAAPVFSQVERQYNRRLAERLEARLIRCEVILPQDFRVGPAGTPFNDRRHLAGIHRRCLEALCGADVVVALLDGADVDSGVAYEVGYARASGKPVLGVRTDYRQSQVKGLNVMLAEGCTEVLCHFSFNENLDSLVEAMLPRIETLTTPRAAPPNPPGPGRTRSA